MKIKDVTAYLEALAPLSLQESYDNSGLIVGHPEDELNGILVSLDCTEEIVDEAVRTGCNLVVSHHPVVFRGLKKLNGNSYVERTVMKAIRQGIALYAIHTNFDNYQFGVNREIGERLGLQNLSVLAPKAGILNKLVCYVPENDAYTVLEAMFAAGAGRIGNYAECSFSMQGQGTFLPLDEANPAEGEVGVKSTVEERRLEVLVDAHSAGKVIAAMKTTHPYEEVAYELYALLNENQTIGAGMIGELPEPMDEKEFLAWVKKTFGCGVIRHTRLLGKEVRKVAFCGGSGSFLLRDAIRSGADVYISGDFKYHEFFDAEDRIVIADIGHFESEQFTSQRLVALLTKKFPKFAVRLTEVDTNPINYF